MNLAERGTLDGVVDRIVLNLVEGDDFMMFRLSYTFVGTHTVGAQILHAIQTPRVRPLSVLAVCARRWVRDGQNVQHVHRERVVRNGGQSVGRKVYFHAADGTRNRPFGNAGGIRIG